MKLPETDMLALRGVVQNLDFVMTHARQLSNAKGIHTPTASRLAARMESDLIYWRGVLKEHARDPDQLEAHLPARTMPTTVSCDPS